MGTDEFEGRLFISVTDEKSRYLNCHSKCVGGSRLPVGVIAFHLSTEHILVPSLHNDGRVNIKILTKDGKPVHAIRLETEKIHCISGITVNTEGRIALLCTTQYQRNHEGHLVFVV